VIFNFFLPHHAMNKLVLAAVQTNPAKVDIQGNLKGHIRVIETVADHGTIRSVFPEMAIIR
jgi:predicted amidohydrolase